MRFGEPRYFPVARLVQFFAKPVPGASRVGSSGILPEPTFTSFCSLTAEAGRISRGSSAPQRRPRHFSFCARFPTDFRRTPYFGPGCLGIFERLGGSRYRLAALSFGAGDFLQGLREDGHSPAGERYSFLSFVFLALRLQFVSLVRSLWGAKSSSANTGWSRKTAAQRPIGTVI